MNETPKTITVRMTESYSTWIVRESVELNVEDYPELKGMTQEEMEEYISENWDSMKSTNDSLYDSLVEECRDSDIESDRVVDEETGCEFD
jgi:alpha-D-ribose 1-methylphosphonate 5-triphosphate diphosphatase PhnM